MINNGVGSVLKLGCEEENEGVVYYFLKSNATFSLIGCP